MGNLFARFEREDRVKRRPDGSAKLKYDAFAILEQFEKHRRDAM